MIRKLIYLFWLLCILVLCIQCVCVCLCVLSHFSSVWLFVILIDCRPPGSSIMGFSRKGCWSGLPCPPPGDLPDPGIKLASLMSPTLARGFFTTNTTYACVHAKLLQLFPTLCHPMDYIQKTISFFFFFPCCVACGILVTRPEIELVLWQWKHGILTTELLEVKVLVTLLCLTLCNPMDCSPEGSSVHAILQARILESVATPGDLSNRGIELLPSKPPGSL